MSQMMQLDALVTMLACLTTTQVDHQGPPPPPPPPDNTTAGQCPLSTLSGITSNIQELSADLARAREQMDKLQEVLVDLQRWGTARSAAADLSFGPRINDLQPPALKEALVPAGAVAARAAVLGEPSGVPITPRNCLGQQNGVVRIRLQSDLEPFFVFCDQKTRGGGWIVVVNRYDGSEDFNRKWNDYKIGFGPLTTEFFIGLEKLHQITTSEDYELLALLENRNQDKSYALYDHFSIGSESEQYRLNVLGTHQGNASDGLRQHLGKKFSTQDRDNDESDSSCAAAQSSAFWYSKVCNLSNPFGLYQKHLDRDVDDYRGILWHGFLDGPKGSLKMLRLLVRPRSAGN